MKRLNRLTRVSALTVGILATVAVVSTSATAQTADPIKIGEINHYKRMAAFAEPYKNGIELRLEEINADGGVLGRPLEFIYRDDQGKPGEAIKIAEELVNREEVTMLTGTILSNIGLALSSFAAEKKVVYLASEPLADALVWDCLLYTSPSPRDRQKSRMPSSA